MSTDLEVVKAGPQSAALVQTATAQAMALVADAVQRGADVATMQALIEMRNSIEDRERKTAFNAALIAAQVEMPRITKNASVINHKTNQVQSRYATLEHIEKLARPIYQQHGFAVAFSTTAMEAGKYWMCAKVTHVAGHSEDYKIPLALDQTGSKNDTQGMGSVVSYARRYLLCMIFNIVIEGEDTDGNKPRQEPTLTQDQQDTLKTLLDDQKRDRAKFFEWVSKQAGREITTLAQIPQRLQSQILQALKGGAK